MVVNFFGRRGSGKTTAIKGVIQYCKPPVVIIDVLGNFENEEFRQTESIPEALQALKEYAENLTPKIIVLKTSSPSESAEYISSALWHIHGGTLILDEVDSIHFKEGDCFDEFIRYGRNHGGDLITGCRRPAELDRNITAAANKFYCFSTHEYRDIIYFSENVFGDRAEELMTLPKFHGMFLDYDKNTIGKFFIDRNGQIYHTEESQVS